MNFLKNKKGTVLLLGAFLVLIIVLALLEANKIYEGVSGIMERQNKVDAHMLSVMGLYVETLDKVSWVNKQLRRIAMLAALLSFTPQLAPLVAVTLKMAKGLEVYQDLLLVRLKTYALILDNKLRLENGLSVPGNYHYFEYRRQLPIDLIFIVLPGLIEINSDIFGTACVKHKGLITNTKTCIDSNDYNKEVGWFAPTEESWGVVMDNAY